MSHEELRQYDLFLDENDWDIYYWATQEPSPTSSETAEGGAPAFATPTARGQAKDEPTETWRNGAAKSGEWAQTVGAFKPAYRPVPARWKDSEILKLLREHVASRSALGETKSAPKIGGGLGRMPEIQTF